MDRICERLLLGLLRAASLAHAHGQVLEIGAGTGANFPYYHNIEGLSAV